MTALTVPTLVVAGLFDPSVSVLPLGDKQAMVTCACLSRPTPYSNVGPDHDGSPDECPDCYMGKRPFEGPLPIHIAHQCPECMGSGRIGDGDGQEYWDVPCRKCGGSGWLVRSAQAEQVDLRYRNVDAPSGEPFDVHVQWQLRVSGVSSETAPYLGDVTPGWRA